MYNYAKCSMEFKTALKFGLYDFENARNWYRTISLPDNGGAGLHKDLVFKWIRVNAVLLSPFTPHFSEHVWQNVLGETGSIQNARFPESVDADVAVLQQTDYMRSVVDNLRSAEATAARRKGKGKNTFDPSKPKSARIYVATAFPDWQDKCLVIVKSAWDASTKSFDDLALRKGLEAAGLMKDKRAMPFCQAFKVCHLFQHC